ncbi:MAG TPA: hypothetical protein VF657_13480 [Actinoplanes sp.]|jgi:hypothetical protein
MTRPLQPRRLVASLLPLALIGAGLTVSSSPASAADAAPETGPVRVVHAATSDRVEVFAGDLSTTAEFGGGAIRPDSTVLSAAYDAAQKHPDDLAPPYAEGARVVTPAATTAGANLLTRATGLRVPDSPARYSTAALQRIEFAIGDLKGEPFASAQIGAAYLQASRNRVVVDAVTASDELRKALAARFGADAVAVHLAAPVKVTEVDDGRYNDGSSFEGGSEIGTSRGVAGTCTSGFAWSASAYGDMMVTAGHCTTAGGNVYGPSGASIGTVRVDSWANTSGSAQINGTYRGDISVYEIVNGETSTPYVHNGAPNRNLNPTNRLPVLGRLTRWLVPNDQLCTDGSRTGELCGWQVLRVQTTLTYESGLVARNVFTATKTAGACATSGDSGGPIYAKNNNGIIYAIGVISGADLDRATGTPSQPCLMIGTEMQNIWQGLPGDLKVVS